MDCDSVCLQPTDTSWVTTTIIDSCWIPLSHYYYLQTLTLLAWHEVAQDAVSGTSSITALQDRNVLKRAVVQCLSAPWCFTKLHCRARAQNWWFLKIGFPTPLKLNEPENHLFEKEHHLPNFYFWIPS